LRHLIFKSLSFPFVIHIVTCQCQINACNIAGHEYPKLVDSVETIWEFIDLDSSQYLTQVLDDYFSSVTYCRPKSFYKLQTRVHS